MKDTIVQEVRKARAEVAADFDWNLGKFFNWAKTHTAAERKARHPLPIIPGSGIPKSSATKKTAKKPKLDSRVSL